MNKQEAIKKLESIKVIGNDALAACYNESINAGITLMKKNRRTAESDRSISRKMARRHWSCSLVGFSSRRTTILRHTTR